MTDPQPARRRRALLAVAAGVAAADLLIKAAAEQGLRSPIDLGVIQLRLTYNSGVAFSLGRALPAWTVLAVTAAIILALLTYAWRTVPHSRTVALLAMAAILGGAAGNLVDRATDGVVTDYLHTGWFPTFNLADIFIVGGAAILTLAHLVTGSSAETARAPGPSS